jgi:hypothetical protein
MSNITTLYDSFIIFIYVLKISFVILSITKLYLIKKDPKNKWIDTIIYWKDRVEFVFVICMALLLIYIFLPSSNSYKKIDKHTQLLFGLFGILLLFTAKWQIFVSETRTISDFQKVLGQNANQ